MTDATVEEWLDLAGLFPDGIPVTVGTGLNEAGEAIRKDNNGKKVNGPEVGKTLTVPVADFLRWPQHLQRWVVWQGMSRIPGAKLNEVPTDDGRKLAAMEAALKMLANGQTPADFESKRRAPVSGLDDVTLRALRDLQEAAIAAFKPHAKPTGGKNGNRVTVADVLAVIQQHPQYQKLVKADRSDWDHAACVAFVRADKDRMKAAQEAVEAEKARAAVDIADIKI